MWLLSGLVFSGTYLFGKPLILFQFSHEWKTQCNYEILNQTIVFPELDSHSGNQTLFYNNHLIRTWVQGVINFHSSLAL